MLSLYVLLLSGCFGLVGNDSGLIGNGTDSGNVDTVLEGNFSGPLVISPERPLLIVSGYATHINGQYNPDEAESDKWWEGFQTPTMVWNSIPDSLKPYSIFSFHTNFVVGSRRGTYGAYAGDDMLKRWFEDQIKVCQRNEIPVVPIIWSAWKDWYAFNEIDPADETWREWLDYLVTTYSCIKGFVTTENHHASRDVNVPRFNSWLEFCDAHDLKLFIGDSANSIYTYTEDSTFKAAVEKYGKDHLVMNVKDTKPLRWAIGYSYMQGLWLNDQNYAYGALIDTWTWDLRGYKKLGDSSGGGEQVRQALIHPEGLLHNYLINQYINGATVFNFEIPWQVYGIYGRTSEVLENVVAPFFEWMVENPAPTKDEILEMTRYVFYGDGMAAAANNYEKLYPDGMLKGLVMELHKTGRYGLVPGLLKDLNPNGALKRAIDSGKITIFDGSPNGSNDNLVEQAKWEEAYPDKSLNSELKEKHLAFVAHRKTAGTGNTDTWYLYNHKVNDVTASDVNKMDGSDTQYARIPLGEANSGKKLEVALLPHTGVIVKDYGNGRGEVFMSNFRLYKDHAMEDLPSGGVYIGGKPGPAYEWILENMTVDGSKVQDNIKQNVRDTRFTFYGTASSEAFVTARQTNGQIVLKQEGSVVTITGNGWLRFEFTY